MSPNLLLPRLYASHPSRPTASSLSTLDPDTPTGPYIVVIVVVPSPINVEDERKLDVLQQLRQRWDQAYPRWVPHVTLIPPFVVPQQDEPQGAGPAVQIDTFQPQEEKQAEEKEQQGVTVFALKPSTTEASSQHAAPPLPESAQYSPRVITAQDVSSALNGLSETLTRVCAETPVFKLHLNDVGTFKLREYTNVHLRPRLGTTSGEESLLAMLRSRLVYNLPAYVTAQEGRRKPHHPPTRAQSNSRHPQQLFSADNSPDTRINRSERRRRALEEAGILSPPVQVGKTNTERNESDPARAGADLRLREERHVAIPSPIERRGLRGVPEASMARDQGDPTLQQESVATTSNDRQPERRASSSGRAGASQSDQQRPRRANRASKRKVQPHVSVGQARGYSQLRTLEKLARELLCPEAGAEGGEGGVDGIECLVDKVYLLAKPQGKTGPYELFKVVPLARPQTSESEAERMRVVEGTQHS